MLSLIHFVEVIEDVLLVGIECHRTEILSFMRFYQIIQFKEKHFIHSRHVRMFTETAVKIMKNRISLTKH